MFKADNGSELIIDDNLKDEILVKAKVAKEQRAKTEKKAPAKKAVKKDSKK